MGDWFEELSAKRKRWLDSTRENNFEKGIWQSSVEKYADPVHFVYELLQNAEDQGATEATFSLEDNRLVFEHNGRCFTPQDVENITGIGNTNKPEQANAIGRFGIGFKSVFVVTDRPEVYSFVDDTPLPFAIEDLVVPVRIRASSAALRQGWTRFVLSFRREHSRKHYSLILGRLRDMGADTLLFLRNLTAVKWSAPVEEERGLYRCERCAENHEYSLLGERETRGTRQSEDVKYLVFSRRVLVPDADRELSVSLAFAMEDGKIAVGSDELTLDVYFPTEEKTGLRFRLHAPFLLTDNRGNIKRGEPLNDQLLRECAVLLAESLPKLRDLGLLDVNCLACLPIGDEAPAFRCLSDAVTAALKGDYLLPTDDGCHSRAGELRLARGAAVRTLVTPEQLGDLMGADGPLRWVTSSVTENKPVGFWNYLQETVGVPEVDPALFARRLSSTFLEKQPDAWMARLYGFLKGQRALWERRSYEPSLRNSPERPIIRLADGLHVAPFDPVSGKPNAYLPLAHRTGHPTVKRCIVEDADALEFLEQLGLKAPDVLDDVIVLTLPRYRQDADSTTEEQYAQDLEQIGEAITRCPAGKRSQLRQMLCDTPFVLAENAADVNCTQFKKPGDTYLEAPELREWFGGNPEAWFVSRELDELESWAQIREFLHKDTDAPRRKIHIRRRASRCDGHVYIQSDWGQHTRGLDGFDPDAQIDGLEYALKHPTPSRARLVWDVLKQNAELIGGIIETATRQDYSNACRGWRGSRVGSLCAEHAWLPDRSGEFHRPCDLSVEDLPDEFDADFAEVLGVEMSAPLPSDAKAEPEDVARDALAQAADDLGVSVEDLKKIRENPDDFRAWVSAQRKPTFPVVAPRQPAIRAGKVVESAVASPEKEYEMRSRSVRTTAGYTNEDRDTYLRDLYTNMDGQMVCQICQNEMPFRRKDGEYYFEVVACVSDAAREHYQNYLALCPTCAAKFHHSNYTSASELRQAVVSAPELDVPVVLDHVEHSIRFVETHLLDLRVVLGIEA
ncbi:MAG: hypothetical protein GX774_18940 [Armatimonadetes bacterium]|nr:hypothetical protein [Armatimonadota bacterium]